MQDDTTRTTGRPRSAGATATPRPARATASKRAAPKLRKATPARPTGAVAPAQAAREYPTVALALQGGGALGAYQCGVYEALHAAGLRPNWYVGTSIGAINAAILAGNPPDERVARLHEFWDTICEPGGAGQVIAAGVRAWLDWMPPAGSLDAWANSLGALGALVFGQQGFFRVRPQPPFLRDDGSPAATSFYDTTPLRATLERCVDFERINRDRAVRLSVGATNVETGNVRYFDSRDEPIGPEHIMASGALPPAFPAVTVGACYYWDGGLASNTPLERVWDDNPRRDTLVFQVDLWSARGQRPQTLMDVLDRQKDIQFSSRTRHGTDQGALLQKLRLAIEAVLEQAGPGTLDEKLRQTLRPWACTHVYNIVHLIYQAKPHEAQYKDYAFGPGTQREHWEDGRADMEQTLEHPEFFTKPSREAGVVTHDVHRLAAARRRRHDGGAP